MSDSDTRLAASFSPVRHEGHEWLGKEKRAGQLAAS